MRYYLDTEFNQTVDPVELISIAIVAEDGREFYAALSDFSTTACDDWLKANVLPMLHDIGVAGPTGTYVGTRPFIKICIEDFIGDDPTPEFWAYFGAYDWYLFTRLWGFMDMPKRYPKLCMDIKQEQLRLGGAALPTPFQPEHHALVDARWNKVAHESLIKRHG